MTTTVRLADTPITSHSYHFVVVAVVRTFKISSFNFPVYNTVLLTLVTMLYGRAQNLLIL